MKRTALLLALLSGFALPALAAGPVTFEGSIWDGGAVSLRFDEHVPAGQKRTMQLPDRQVVEMSVDAAGQATVRMVGPDGKELHAQTRPVGGPDPFVFRYAFCRKGAIAFTSPPKGEQSGCP